jgi:hypothetical protein
MREAFALAMAETAAVRKNAAASREADGQERAARARRTSGERQQAKRGATSTTAAPPAALDSLSRIQQLADASPRVAQLRRLQALADGPAGSPSQKAGIESLAGVSMDHAWVHDNASQLAQLNALGFAPGSDIHLAPWQERHLPHEAWHVAQQAQAPVQPTMQMKDRVPVNDDTGLEREAAKLGARALVPVAQLTGGLKEEGLPDRKSAFVRNISGANINALSMELVYPVQMVAMATPEDYEKSKKQHDRDREALAFAVNKGAETSPTDELSLRLRNSCEWILAERLHLIALTKTADSEFRKKSEGETAYFPLLTAADEDVVHGKPKYYVNDVENWENVFTDDGAALGGSAGNMIYFFNASQNMEEINNTLRHEVQHAADHHDEEEASSALVTFKTEYRAHYYQGTFNESTEETVAKMGYTWNKLHYAVTSHIMKNYPEVKEAWDRNTGGFREEVVKYANPDTEAINKYNSARIENLYLSIALIKPEELDYRFRLRKFKLEIEQNKFALDKFDIRYLKSTESTALKDRMLRAIKPGDWPEIKGLINEMVLGKPAARAEPVIQELRPTSKTVSEAKKNISEAPVKPSKPTASAENAPKQEPLVPIREVPTKTLKPPVKPSAIKSQVKKGMKEKGVPQPIARQETKYLREDASLRGNDKEKIAALPKGAKVTIPLPQQKLTFSLGGFLRLGGLLSTEKEHTWVNTDVGNGWVRTEAL